MRQLVETINLQNENFSASISPLGAELKSLVEKKTGTEYIWCGDPAWWNGSAPVLFPIVGGLKDQKYNYNGKTYSIANHGFARRSRFKLISSTQSTALFELNSNIETKKMYPFDFSLQVLFSLEFGGIAVQYNVKNNGTGQMFFSIGSHPAFNLPFAGGYIENYYIHFGEEENMERYFFENGLYRDKTAPVFSNCRQISLDRKIFNDGPLIFKKPVSTEFHIKNSLNSKEIIVSTEEIPYLAIWSKGDGAPFVSIEPWFGLPDVTTTNQDFAKKEGILSLESGKTFSSTYRIEVTGDQ